MTTSTVFDHQTAYVSYNKRYLIIYKATLDCELGLPILLLRIPFNKFFLHTKFTYTFHQNSLNCSNLDLHKKSLEIT